MQKKIQKPRIVKKMYKIHTKINFCLKMFTKSIFKTFSTLKDFFASEIKKKKMENWPKMENYWPKNGKFAKNGHFSKEICKDFLG